MGALLLAQTLYRYRSKYLGSREKSVRDDLEDPTLFLRIFEKQAIENGAPTNLRRWRGVLMAADRVLVLMNFFYFFLSLSSLELNYSQVYHSLA